MGSDFNQRLPFSLLDHIRSRSSLGLTSSWKSFPGNGEVSGNPCDCGHDELRAVTLYRLPFGSSGVTWLSPLFTSRFRSCFVGGFTTTPLGCHGQGVWTFSVEVQLYSFFSAGVSGSSYLPDATKLQYDEGRVDWSSTCTCTTWLTWRLWWSNIVALWLLFSFASCCF